MPTSLGRYETLPTADTKPAAITADGGCRLSNPSTHGGMWAFRLTNAAGEPIIQAAGVVLVREVSPLTTVTNNLTETLALLIGLEFLPDGWSGRIRSDSLNALRVFQNYRDEKKLRNMRVWLPADFLRRITAVRERLGAVTYELLGGHPGRQKGALALLHAGQTVKNHRGYPFCLHNHWCDEAATAAWGIYESEQEELLR
jgi:ribonuclease HI